jgi:hypothetical protein
METGENKLQILGERSFMMDQRNPQSPSSGWNLEDWLESGFYGKW